jgi:ParB family chromosome partitioning protein
MQLQLLKVSACYESETNPRGAKFEGKSFDELVASIKEKGVLMPILVRQEAARMNKAGTDLEARYEVIAGNRRLRAAKILGQSVIPAHIVVMTDDEAREAQIVENLQREDIHPLEEGQAYRDLIEGAKLTVKDVAIKVGKSETYVRDRLFLTNLTPASGKAYRSGKIADTVAVLIAKLSATDQVKTLEYAEGDEWEKPSASDVKDWIRREFSSSLARQPWLKDKAAVAVLPPHLKNCHPNDSALFGDLKEGQCTDLDCWEKRMTAWTKYRRDNTPNMVIVSDSYGGTDKPDLMSRNSYVRIEAKKDRCKFAIPAIVGEGEEIGNEIAVCISPECKKHFSEHSEYKRTPKEEAERKEARKKAIEAAKKAKDAQEKKLADALAQVKWPFAERHLEALLALTLDNCSSNTYRNIAKRHELEVKKEKMTYGATSYDYVGAVKAYAKTLDSTGKAQLAFEMLIDTGYDSLRPGIGKLVA